MGQMITIAPASYNITRRRHLLECSPANGNVVKLVSRPIAIGVFPSGIASSNFAVSVHRQAGVTEDSLPPFPLPVTCVFGVVSMVAMNWGSGWCT